MPQSQSSRKIASRPDVATWRTAILAKLVYALGKDQAAATGQDWFLATSLAVRDRIIERWIFPTQTATAGHKRVYYLSIEYLIGRLLLDALSNLDVVEPVHEALTEMGVDLDQVRDMEADAGLGNGGLGRLAACFMDSMAALGIPAIGYGIRYRYGLFKQQITDGVQEELPDDWLARAIPGNSSAARSPIRCRSAAGGLCRHRDQARRLAPRRNVDGGRLRDPGRRLARPPRECASAVVGPRQRTGRATAQRPGGYDEAMAANAQAEAICATLYPSDATPAGQELRLRQEYFFTAASLQDILHQHLQTHGDLRSLPSAAAIQLNDTHPAIAVAELMRLLVDEHGFAWADAWTVTTGTLNYTNHTLLPEALERWPVALLERLLPRHLQIIYRINWLHLAPVGGTRLRRPRPHFRGLADRRSR